MVQEGEVEKATEQGTEGEPVVEVAEEVVVPSPEETAVPPAEETSEEAPPEETKPEHLGRKVERSDRGESFWSPKELAAKMACTQSYIYLMIKQGKIKVVKQGRLVKISPDEVQRVLTDGLPLPPKPEPKIEADEIVVTDERILKKMKPPAEPTEEPKPEEGKPGWPFSMLFKD